MKPRPVWVSLVVAVLLFAACGSDASVDNRGDRVSDPTSARDDSDDHDDADSDRESAEVQLIIDEVDGPRGEVLASTVASTADGSAKMALTTEIGSIASITIDGELDFERREGSFIMSTDALGGALGSEPGEGDEVIEIRMVDGFVYLKVPQDLRGDLAGGDTEWIGIDLDAASAAGGSDADSAASLQDQVDPSVYLDFLRAVSDDIEVVEREDVRGEATTHYAGTLDLANAFDELSDDVQDTLDDALGEGAESQFGELFELFGLDEVPFDVWVDDEHRLRKLVFEVDFSELADAAGEGESPGFDASLSMTFELYDYGTKIDVEAPPDRDVEIVDPSELGGTDTKFEPGDSSLS